MKGDKIDSPKDEQKQKFFVSTIKLFEDYRNKMIREKVEGYNSGLSNEVHIRLSQCSFICEKVLNCEKIIVGPTSSKKELCKQARLFNEGIVFVEAFYFFAWRIICIATNKRIKALPGLEGLKKKAKGVVLVRNCLIEHPENQKEKIFNVSYSWGDKDGPKLKVARPQGQTFEIKDRGFWINAQEFKDGLEELLQNYVKQ